MTRHKEPRRTRQSSRSKNSSSLKLVIGIILFIFVLYKQLPSYLFVLRPTPSSISPLIPNTLTEPTQNELSTEEPPVELKSLQINGENISFKPIARYEIDATIVSKRHYHKKWDGKVMPVDLALVWGKLSQEINHQHMSYRHSDRYFSWNQDHEGKLDRKYIISHSANVHLIAANKHIEKALISTDIGENIKIIGYLVDVFGPGGDTRRTSITRDDAGSGACENLYIQQLQIGNQLFQ